MNSFDQSDSFAKAGSVAGSTYSRMNSFDRLDSQSDPLELDDSSMPHSRAGGGAQDKIRMDSLDQSVPHAKAGSLRHRAGSLDGPDSLEGREQSDSPDAGELSMPPVKRNSANEQARGVGGRLASNHEGIKVLETVPSGEAVHPEIDMLEKVQLAEAASGAVAETNNEEMLRRRSSGGHDSGIFRRRSSGNDSANDGHGSGLSLRAQLHVPLHRIDDDEEVHFHADV